MSIHATLRHYARVIRHHNLFILSCIALCTGLTYAVSVYLPPTYQANILVKVTPLNPNTTNTVSTDTINATIQMQTADYTRLVSSPDVLQAAAKTLAGTSMDQLDGAISSSTVDQTQFVMIDARGNSSQQALKRVNAVAHSFVQVQETKEGTQLQITLAHISQEIIGTRQQLMILSQAPATSPQKSLLDSEQSHYNQVRLEYNQLQLELTHVPELLSLPEAASTTPQPVSPVIQHNTLLAAVISLTLALLIALLRDWLNTAIQTSEDIYQQVGLTSLGQIPYQHSLKQAAQLLDFSQEKFARVRAAYTVMGIRFQVLYKGQSALLCTSLRRGSGTTTTAAQLAVNLAQTGMRILLIDTHIQQPALPAIFNLPDTHGLTTSLSDIHHFHEQPTRYPAAWLAQWKTYVPNLWLLPGGPAYAGSQGQFSLSDLVQLKEWLLGQHSSELYPTLPRLIDLIIFDAEPLDTGTMAHILTAVADASILTIPANTAQPEALTQANQTLQQLETPVIGIVLTRHKARHRSYFYSKPQRIPQADTPVSLPDPVSQPANQKNLPQLELPETPPPWRKFQFQSLPEGEVASKQDFQTSLALPILPQLKKLPAHTNNTLRIQGSSLRQFQHSELGEQSREQLT